MFDDSKLSTTFQSSCVHGELFLICLDVSVFICFERVFPYLLFILHSVFVGSVCLPVFVFINEPIQSFLDSTGSLFSFFVILTYHWIVSQSKVCLEHRWSVLPCKLFYFETLQLALSRMDACRKFGIRNALLFHTCRESYSLGARLDVDGSGSWFLW